jgi:hypothetical protein
LSDPLSGNPKMLTDFFQSAGSIAIEGKTQFQDFGFPIT